MTLDDDNTLDTAGPMGRNLADVLADKIMETIDGFPDSSREQRSAIARMVARTIDGYAEENER